MPRLAPALAASRALLRILIVLNWLAGAFILALLLAFLAAPEWTVHALGGRPGNAALLAGFRWLAVVGIVAVAPMHIILTRLDAIVGTVAAGDPFVAANAARLQAAGWALVALELLHLAVGAIAALASTLGEPLEIGWSFSLNGWLGVLLLFVLARVFAEGAAMRADLEGTV